MAEAAYKEGHCGEGTVGCVEDQVKRKGKSLVSGAREENAGYGLDPPFRVWSDLITNLRS